MTTARFERTPAGMQSMPRGLCDSRDAIDGKAHRATDNVHARHTIVACLTGAAASKLRIRARSIVRPDRNCE